MDLEDDETTVDLLAQRHALRDRRDALRRILEAAGLRELVPAEQAVDLARELASCEKRLQEVQRDLRPRLN
jgi:hypothetical protein